MLQSQTVYSNVSKGVLAKSKDLIAAFGHDDQTKICLEVGFDSISLCFLPEFLIFLLFYCLEVFVLLSRDSRTVWLRLFTFSGTSSSSIRFSGG